MVPLYPSLSPPNLVDNHEPIGKDGARAIFVTFR
jgi:hypothetical protein